MSVFSGNVQANGQITSNGNFSCQYDPGQQKYTIDYNGHTTNPVPVVSPTLMSPGLSYMLYPYSGGFTMQVFRTENGVYTPVQSGFNFIVGEIV